MTTLVAVLALYAAGALLTAWLCGKLGMRTWDDAAFVAMLWPVAGPTALLIGGCARLFTRSKL